jgi:protein-tyrosine phosphatase
MRMERHLPVEGAFNIRDLGGYPTASGRPVAWRRFLRGDSLHRIPAEAVEQLYDEGLRGVIDLRTADEMLEKPSPFAAYPGVHFVNIPLFDALAPDALSRAGAPGEHPLLHFYASALNTRGAALRDILTEMAQFDHGAMLFNCTAGKDRTGLIALLLLSLAGVPRDEIIGDYTRTAELIPDLVAEFLALSRERGGDTESYARMLESPAGTAAAALDGIETEYAGIDGYLRAIGMKRADINRLRGRLLGD